MLLPFALTFGLTLWYSVAPYWVKEPDEFLPPFSLIRLVFGALFSPYMLFTMPVILGGLWLYKMPISVCSTLYATITGYAYFIPSLLVLYITIGTYL